MRVHPIELAALPRQRRNPALAGVQGIRLPEAYGPNSSDSLFQEDLRTSSCRETGSTIRISTFSRDTIPVSRKLF
jgi:hypothetical protein